MTCLSLVVTRRKGGSRIYGNHQSPPWEKEDHQYRSSIPKLLPSSTNLETIESHTIYPRLPVPANRTRPNVTTLFPNFGVGGTKAFRGNKGEKKEKKNQHKNPTRLRYPMRHAMRPNPNSSMPMQSVRSMHARPPNAVVGIPSEHRPNPSSSQTPDHAEKRKKSSNASRESSPFFVALLELPSQPLPLWWVVRTFRLEMGRMGGWRVVCFCE